MDWLLFVRSSGSWPQFIRGIRRRECRLPMLEGHAKRSAFRSRNRGTRWFLDQLPVAQIHQPQFISIEASCDYALRKQRPMIRAYNAIIAAVVKTITYSIF